MTKVDAKQPTTADAKQPTTVAANRPTTVAANRLQATVTEAERCMRHLDVVVPAELADGARQAASRKLAGRMRIKGFRDGKVPAGLVNQRFAGLVLEEAIDELVRASAWAVIESHGLKPVTSVKIDDVDFDAEGPLTFKASFEVAPEVKIRRVGGFVMPPPPGMPPLNGVIDHHLERLRHEFAPLRPVGESDEETPAIGEYVSVVLAHADEDGSGEEEDEGGRSYSFFLGSDQALPGVQEAVQTLTVGEEREFDIDFPGEEVGAPGDTRRLRIRLVGRRVQDVPELNDDFARDMGDYETLDELRAAVRKSLEDLHQEKLEENRDLQLVRMLVEANDFDVPASMVDRVADAIVDEFVKDSGGKPEHVTPENRKELKEALAEKAEFAAKRELLLDRLTEDHGLEASEEDVDAKIESIAEQAKKSPADVYSALQRAGGLDELQRKLTARNIRSFLRRQSGLL